MKRNLLHTSKYFFVIVLFVSLFCQPASAETIRIMAANTTSGNHQAYQDPGIRIFKGLRPDIILIQEFSYENGSIEKLVNEAFGSNLPFFRESLEGDGGNSALPNGIISRFPILETGEIADTNISNRDFPWTRIDIPGKSDLWVVSVHWKAGGSDSNRRSQQASSLISELRNLVPNGDLLAIGGDFNTSNRSESSLAILNALVNTSGPNYPVDQQGDPDTNSSRKKPYDAIYVDEDLEALEIPVVIGNNEFPNGLVFDSRVYSPLSDVTPIQKADSGAPQMQHMAVIRDFEIVHDGST